MSAYVQLEEKECPDTKDTVMMSTVISSGKASSMSVAEVSKQFRTDPDLGLTNEQVQRRRKLHGLNEFDVVEEKPLWRKYIDQVSAVLPVQ